MSRGHQADQWGAADALKAGCWWLMREFELARPSRSKTDCSAIGAGPLQGCSYLKGEEDECYSPFLAKVQQRERLSRSFLRFLTAPEGSLLFLPGSGGRITKAGLHEPSRRPPLTSD